MSYRFFLQNRKRGNKQRFLTKDNCRKYWMGELQAEIEAADSF
ncbi:MAG: hypothetical protein ACJZ59_03270 [Candidatus Thalassarchaeaceae archaeon]